MKIREILNHLIGGKQSLEIVPRGDNDDGGYVAQPTNYNAGQNFYFGESLRPYHRPNDVKGDYYGMLAYAGKSKTKVVWTDESISTVVAYGKVEVGPGIEFTLLPVPDIDYDKYMLAALAALSPSNFGNTGRAHFDNNDNAPQVVAAMMRVGLSGTENALREIVKMNERIRAPAVLQLVRDQYGMGKSPQHLRQVHRALQSDRDLQHSMIYHIWSQRFVDISRPDVYY